MLHPAERLNNINAHQTHMAGMPEAMPTHHAWRFERQSCRPVRQETQDDHQSGGHHGIGRHVQPFSSTVRESIPWLMDVADEEGEMLDLLPVGLRLGAGNRPGTMVSACQRPKMPFCHNSDHRALVAETLAGGGGR